MCVGDQAYYVGPPEEAGPGVLLLPSWWGLTSSARRRADALADAGFTVLAPDLNFGERPETEEEAERALAGADPNRIAAMVMSSADLLSRRVPSQEIGVVGVGMGGSLALWLSVRRPDLVAAAASMYGSQSIDFVGARARYLLQFAGRDRFIPDDDATFLEATMRMEELDVEVVRHEGTRHGFADPEGPTFDEDAAEEAWQRVAELLGEVLAPA